MFDKNIFVVRDKKNTFLFVLFNKKRIFVP